jgi:hypothetical protein
LIIKLILRILLRKKDSYINGIKLNGKTFIVTIDEYIPIEKRMKEWESALNEETTKAQLIKLSF